MNKHIRIIHPAIGAARDLEELQHLERDDLQLSCVGLDVGPSELASQFEAALGVPDTCAKAIAAEKEGVHAIVIDCMGDVGVEEARECVSIPILGPYETSLNIASLLGHKCSVATMVDEVVPVMGSFARKYGFEHNVASIRAINMDVASMMAHPAKRDKRLIELCRQLVVEDGADTIILGCTEMLGAEVPVNEALSAEGISVPIIQPLTAAITVAAALLDAGLTHSKKAFPTPGFGATSGYDFLARP